MTPILYGIGFLFFQYILGLSSISIFRKSLEIQHIKAYEIQIDKKKRSAYVLCVFGFLAMIIISSNLTKWIYMRDDFSWYGTKPSMHSMVHHPKRRGKRRGNPKGVEGNPMKLQQYHLRLMSKGSVHRQ